MCYNGYDAKALNVFNILQPKRKTRSATSGFFFVLFATGFAVKPLA
jgi:hypothetical protein